MIYNTTNTNIYFNSDDTEENVNEDNTIYKTVCPECKNDVETDYLEEGDFFECPVCGITLVAKDIDEDEKTIKNPEIAEIEK